MDKKKVGKALQIAGGVTAAAGAAMATYGMLELIERARAAIEEEKKKKEEKEKEEKEKEEKEEEKEEEEKEEEVGYNYNNKVDTVRYAGTDISIGAVYYGKDVQFYYYSSHIPVKGTVYAYVRNRKVKLGACPVIFKSRDKTIVVKTDDSGNFNVALPIGPKYTVDIGDNFYVGKEVILSKSAFARYDEPGVFDTSPYIANDKNFKKYVSGEKSIFGYPSSKLDPDSEAYDVDTLVSSEMPTGIRVVYPTSVRISAMGFSGSSLVSLASINLSSGSTASFMPNFSEGIAVSDNILRGKIYKITPMFGSEPIDKIIRDKYGDVELKPVSTKAYLWAWSGIQWRLLSKFTPSSEGYKLIKFWMLSNKAKYEVKASSENTITPVCPDVYGLIALVPVNYTVPAIWPTSPEGFNAPAWIMFNISAVLDERYLPMWYPVDVVKDTTTAYGVFKIPVGIWKNQLIPCVNTGVKAAVHLSGKKYGYDTCKYWCNGSAFTRTLCEFIKG